MLRYRDVREYPALNPNKEAKPTIPVPTPELLQSYSRVTPPQVKESKVKESKDIYAEFVLMKPEEHQKLIDEYGKDLTDKFIDRLNTYKGSTGKKYKSDYLAIRSWVIEAVTKKTKDEPKDLYSQARKCFDSFDGGYCSVNENEADPKCKLCRKNKREWRK